MARIRVPRSIGRPRTTPDVVLADKAYSSRAIRSHLRRRQIRAVIPQPADQAANRKRPGSRGGRPPGFDRDAYKHRNTVERCIDKLKQWRGLATRYDCEDVGVASGGDLTRDTTGHGALVLICRPPFGAASVAVGPAGVSR